MASKPLSASGDAMRRQLEALRAQMQQISGGVDATWTGVSDVAKRCGALRDDVAALLTGAALPEREGQAVHGDLYEAHRNLAAAALALSHALSRRTSAA